MSINERPTPAGGGLRALLYALPVLAVPAAGAVLLPPAASPVEALLWLLGLGPVMLLGLARGWRGALEGHALGLLVAALAYVLVLATGGEAPPLLPWVVVLWTLLAFSLAWLVDAVGTDQLARAKEAFGLRDALTDLPNRRHAEGYLEQEVAAAQRGRPLAVVLFDLDDFARFCERNGRAAGDGVLRGFGQVLVRITRRMNMAARFEADAFVCVLGDCDEAGAVVFAGRVQERLRAIESTVPLPTVSVGIAAYRHGVSDGPALLRAAEEALLLAREHGGDRVRVFGRSVNELAALRGVAVEPPREDESGLPPLIIAPVGDEPAKPAGHGLTALVMAGDGALRQRLAQVLEEEGFRLQVASAPGQALAMVRPDCALAVVELAPRAEGIGGIVAEMRRRAEHLRVIGVPHVSGASVEPALLAARVDAYLLGAGDPAALHALVHELLAERSAALDVQLRQRQLTSELRNTVRQAKRALADAQTRADESARRLAALEEAAGERAGESG